MEGSQKHTGVIGLDVGTGVAVFIGGREEHRVGRCQRYTFANERAAGFGIEKLGTLGEVRLNANWISMGRVGERDRR
jgi:hypothetical protein